MKIPGLINIIILNLLIILIPCSGCNRQITTADKLNIKIVSSKINLWIDLMPGIENSHSALHINGKISVKNLSNAAIENLILRNISVAQSKLPINIEPIKFISTNISKSILPNKENTYSINGVKRNPGNIIDNDTDVTLIFNFSSEGISFSDSLKNQIIKKVY